MKPWAVNTILGALGAVTVRMYQMSEWWLMLATIVSIFAVALGRPKRYQGANATGTNPAPSPTPGFNFGTGVMS